MENLMKHMNTSPVLTYRWLELNDCNFESSKIYDQKNDINLQTKGLVKDLVTSTKNGESISYLKEKSSLGGNVRAFVEEQGQPIQTITIDRKIKEPIVIDLSLDSQGYFLRNRLVFEETGDATVIFIQRGKGTHMGIWEVIARTNSFAKIIKVNLMEGDSVDLSETTIQAMEGSNVEVIHINMGEEITVDNIEIDIHKEAKASITGFYIAGKTTQLDMNYALRHIGKDGDSEMSIKGVLDDEAKKTFRGTIDFQKGSAGSKGREDEEVLLLSPKVRNKAMPLILCVEDDVSGEHAASSGRIDEDKLFYLMSRGFTLEESKKMIVEGNFHPILDQIPDADLVEELNVMIQRRLK